MNTKETKKLDIKKLDTKKLSIKQVALVRGGWGRRNRRWS